ncbi:MAG: helix-turn-helix domain-containing protein [Patescibacteria group bacterium]|nr:helix-turn-helix domain-containing protein [Patescibacteria group bacterium]
MNQAQAFSILKAGANVYLTGEPGSGKTYLVNQYVSYLRENGVEPAITASTGIAATHIGGMTIHSWCGIGIKTKLDRHDLDKIASTKYIEKRINQTKVLIIDEVSMLPPETITMIDLVCREVKQNSEPFGGIIVIFVGDFFQLPPIIKIKNENNSQNSLLGNKSAHFAYDSPSWERANLAVCYLDEQFRQEDDNFLSILSSIRRNSFKNSHLCHLETRKVEYHLTPNNIPKLFTHNIEVDRINDEMLSNLKGESKIFNMISQGHDIFTASLKKGCLSPETLYLKIGATVMFTKNNPVKGFVNGTLGVVEEFNQIGNPIVKTRNGMKIKVEPMDWTIDENGSVRGRITQLPLRLAWAITVHKSQGMTLDEAVMDLSDVFEFGQGYVALSRVRKLSGLYLLGWNERAFQVHPEILAKDELFRSLSNQIEIEFAKISPIELEKIYQNFITVCGGESKPRKNKSRNLNYFGKMRDKKCNTYDETLILWNQGKTISQIAKTRGLKEETVLNHLEKLVLSGKINRADISRLITPSLSYALAEIYAAFYELKTKSLLPVFKKFKGAYSYNELRIARMMLKE